MSGTGDDDDGDALDPDANMTSDVVAEEYDCYWYQQGKCFLYEIPEKWVFDFLAQSPKAREDLLRCENLGLCPFVDEDWLSYAERGVTIQDAISRSDSWQSYVNEFIDRHRQIKRGVFRTPEGEGEE